MCGICGYIGNKHVDKEQLWKMNNTMYHRGPNDGGIWQEQGENFEVGLAQRRLSILDLSELGHQPMFTKDGNYGIAYNGEVYNFRQLRKELELGGYCFQSNCDTEVILYAYEKWGTDCFRRFNGMFAIAIYELKKKKLILARDRMGKKPLYFYCEKGHFVFGSELKPIIKYPFFKKEIDKDVLSHFFCNKYLAAPLSIYKNTYKMIPGTYLVYENSTYEIYPFWKIGEAYREGEKYAVNNCRDGIALLDQTIQKAVEDRLVADVPVGTFLSGGIDSTLITVLAQKALKKPIRTYSIGFFDKERNEAPYAAEIARYIGTDHHEYYIGENDIFEMIDDMVYYYDEPFSDSSQLPTMLVSKCAADEITVALSGDGGDELFCGYKMYDWTWIAQHVDFLGDVFFHIPGASQLVEKMSPELQAFLNNRNQNTKVQLFNDVMITETEKILGSTAYNIKYSQERDLKMKNWQIRRMLLDMQTYLPDEVLAKTDRASMKYSLEVRCPLLDVNVVEASFRIPQKYKYHQLDKKYILKQLTYQYVPEKLLDRPKKGFGVPLRRWLRTILKEEVEHYADFKILKQQGIFDGEAVKKLIEKQRISDKVMYSSLLWSFFVFQKWYQMYIEDLWD